jgi:hypothetical protein
MGHSKVAESLYVANESVGIFRTNALVVDAKAATRLGRKKGLQARPGSVGRKKSCEYGGRHWKEEGKLDTLKQEGGANPQLLPASDIQFFPQVYAYLNNTPVGKRNDSVFLMFPIPVHPS